MANLVEQRGVEYVKTSAPQAILNGANAWVSFTSGPNYYNHGGISALVNTMPWPGAPAPATDYFNAPDPAQFNVEIGVVFQISNISGTSIGGYVRAEIVNRTTNTVLATIDKLGSAIVTAPLPVNGAVVLFGSINSSSSVLLMYADDPWFQAAAGDHIGIRITNALDSPATITVGQYTGGDGTVYSPIVRAFEWSYSVDPATQLPVTTTPLTVPILVLATQAIAALNLISGSALITHPDTTTQTYSDTSPTSFFTVQEGDTILMSADGVGNAVQSNGDSSHLLPNTSYKVLTIQDLQPGGITRILQEAGVTFERIGKLLDAESRNEITTRSGTAGVRDTAYQVSVDGSGNMTVSVLDGHVTVSAP